MGKRRPGVQLLTMNDFKRMRLESLDAVIDSRAMKTGSLFIGRYDAGQMGSFLEKTGFPQHLLEKGYTDTRLVIMNDPSGISTFRIYGDTVSPLNLLIDLKASEQRFCRTEGTGDAPAVYDVVLVEWFQSRDVRMEFVVSSNRLPGQDHPGLGALRSFFRLMILIGADISRDAFMAVPDHLHAALMYAGTFHFYDPYVEGTLRALKRDLAPLPLPDIAWAHAAGAIRDAVTRKPFLYRPSGQFFPLSRRMKRYFRSASYLSSLREAFGSRSFVLDSELLERGRRPAMEADLADL